MWRLLCLTALLATGIARPTSNHVLHEKRDVPIRSATKRVDPSAVIPIRIALKQSNLEAGDAALMDVSDPSSPNYGKHFTAEEAHAFFAPAEESYEAVKDWLLESIAETDIVHYENKGWLAIDMPASLAESLFSTEYYEYERAGSTRIGSDAYYLPSHVAAHVDFVKPGVVLSQPVKKRIVKRDGPWWPSWPGGHGGWPHHKPPHLQPPHYPNWQPPHGAMGLPPALRNCGVNITIACIKALYQIPSGFEVPHDPSNVMGVYEIFDAYAQADLNLDWANFAPYVPQGTGPKVNSIDGGTAPVAASSIRNSGESDIDLQLAISLIYPQEVTVYQVDDLPNAEGLFGKPGFINDFLDAVDGSYCNYTAYGITGNSPKIDPVYPDPKKGGYKGQLQCGVYSLTRVVSVSYGESEQDLPRRYQARQCNEVMKLSLQGHSFLVASGDYGVAGYPGDNNNTFGCLSAPGMNGTIYNPDCLSSCPYWTSVGATMLYPDQTVNDPESAMQVNLQALHAQNYPNSAPYPAPYALFATSGGFSNYYSTPSYQAAAVSAYLASHNTLPYYIANSVGSNIGENGGVYNRGGRGFPDVSANGAFLLSYNNLTRGNWFGTSLSSPIFGSVLTLLNEERTAIGKGPVGFVNPVLYAHPEVLNDITNGSNPNCGSSGFEASVGWDPVTGLGTPNYPKMRELFLSLP